MAIRHNMILLTAGLLAAFCAANGLFMLTAPARWFWAVPGVPLTGGYNAHFIRDIGLVYLMTAGALLLGMRRRAARALAWGMAAAWLAGHAAFHLWEVAVGICGPIAIPRDFLGVTLPGFAAAIIAAAALKESEQEKASA